ncbi:MAG: AzlD domain-containing protein [Rhodobacterales bacterium]|nr:AzlD domain-containing protein [Rhodobacterales bacterium]
MNWDLMTVALMAGAANWAFRALPILGRTRATAAGGWPGRFLSSTGPAAIGTLFVAAILPSLTLDPARLLPVITGTLAVLAVFVLRKSVVLATLAGAFAHGVTVWLLG